MATYTYTTTCTHHIELDLSAACTLGPNSIQDRINDVVPGLKTSTGEFFIYLFSVIACISFAVVPSSASLLVLKPCVRVCGLALHLGDCNGANPPIRHWD